MEHALKLDMDAFTIERALSGQQAIEIVERDLLDHNGLETSIVLILMDCNMPFMDGYTCTTEIRKLLHAKNVL